MTGFDSWRSPDGEALGAPHTGRLPARRGPSRMDRLREQAERDGSARSSDIGRYEIAIGFTDLVADRTDSPYYVALSGRAAICLRLTSENLDDLEELYPVAENGGQVHFHAYTRDYPILRAVLWLPTESPLSFESPLLLTNGDVQEFVTAALANEHVELHLSKTGDDRTMSLDCRARNLATVLGGAVDTLSVLDHPRDDDRIRRSVDLMEVDFPSITDGLSRETLVVLEPLAAARPIAVFTMDFTE